MKGTLDSFLQVPDLPLIVIIRIKTALKMIIILMKILLNE